MEKFVSLKSKNGRLFGVIYTPEINSLKSGVLITAPFGGEKIFSHRSLVTFARVLCKSGITVFRFDYSGTGDSEHRFENASVTSRLSDVETAFNFLNSLPGVNSSGVLGVRSGAAWVLQSINNKLIEPDWLCLIDPVLNLKRFLDQALRTNVAAQMTTYKEVRQNRKELVKDILEGKCVSAVGGFPLAKPFYAEAHELDLIKDLEYKKIPILITCTKPIESKPSPEITGLLECLKKKGFEPNLEMTPGPIYWERPKEYFDPPSELFSKTLAWLNSLKICENIEGKSVKLKNHIESSYTEINNNEQFVFFRNKENRLLPGILHKPEFAVEEPIGIFFVELGIGTRTGTNGLNANLARSFSDMGFLSLRIDVKGCGDAEGDWGKQPIPQYFESIEAGLFRNDLKDIMEQIVELTDCRSWYIIAHCGAATSAAQSYHFMDTVEGMVLIEMPFKPSYAVNTEDIQKAKSLKSWVRLFKGKSDYRYIANKILNQIRQSVKQVAYKYFSNKKNSVTVFLQTTVDSNGFNKPVVEGFRKMIQDKKDILLIWCESSTAALDFYANELLIAKTKRKNNYEVVKILESNHTFFLQDSQNKLIDTLIDWFTQRQPNKK